MSSKGSDRRWQAWMVVAVVVLLVMSACSSTGRKVAVTPEPSGQLGDELGGTPAGVDATSASGVSSGPGVQGTRRSPTRGTISTGGSTPAAGGSGPRRARLSVGPGVHGVTDTTIQVGIVSANSEENVDVANAVTGGNIGSGSYQKRNKAIVDYINATGGIAGRKVETVVYYQDSNQKFTSSGRQREYQRMCSTWTEDHRVFVMSGHAIWGDSGVMFDCAAKTKTPIVMNGFQQPISQRHFESMADYWYAPDWFVADSRERAVGRFLLAHGFFAKGARVGVLIEDTPDIREGVERGLKPVLAAAGIKPALEIFYPDNIESPWPNYVLQLQQARVTHIVMSATSGTALSLLFMMRAAEDQGYRPKWGVGSDNAPGDLVDYSAPEEQMANVLGAGWFPGYDLPGEYPPVSDNDQICREVLKKAGQEDKAGQWRDANLSFCESLLFLRAAFQRAEVVSPKGLAAAVAKLADTYPSTVTVGGATRFGPRRHQGVTVGRLVRWDRGARQLKYASGPEPLAG